MIVLLIDLPIGCTDKVNKFLKAHGALVDTNCMEFPNLNFALDWAETKLLNGAYSSSAGSLQQPISGGSGGGGTEQDEQGDTDARDRSFTKLGKG